LVVGFFCAVETGRTDMTLKATGSVGGTPILDQLAELDEIMSAKEGVNWVYSLPPDLDGPFLLADGEDFILGPGARAAILDMRKIDNLIATASHDAETVGAVAG
jgi:hypothetical protein